MEFISEALATYCENHTSPENDLLKLVSRETHLKVLRARMLSGHLQGRTLSLFSKMIKPKYVLEIGTYTGYSALCMAEGLQADGKLVTIDINEELEDFVQDFFTQSTYKNQIEYKIADAIELIPTLNYDWDLVFIDADKINYINYYNLLIDNLKSGAYIIADNVLWSGKVVEPVSAKDKDTQLLLDFNKLIHDDQRVENLLLPIRDGLMILRKK